MKIKRFLRINVTRLLMKIFWFLPIKKKQIFFSAYEGKQYSCNPKALYESMLKDNFFEKFTFVWELNIVKNIDKTRNLKIVKHNSFRYFFNILTSKWIITNTGICGRIPIRKKQININTWHGGGAYKKVGYAINEKMSGDLKELSIASNQTTYFLSSSKIFSDVMSPSVRLSYDKFLPSGMPRNDVFFNTKMSFEVREKVLKSYGLSGEEFIILYAPTYRGNVGNDSFDIDFSPLYSVKREVEKKLNRQSVLMVRLHYFSKNINIDKKNILFVSDYPDMQDLLVAADMLITDYSSSIWDFALSKKPCILYTPDLDNYNLDRGFYSSPYSWPGLLCKSEEQMIEAVKTFNLDAYQKRISDYLENSISYEKGNSCQTVIDLIKEDKNGKKQ